MFRHGALIGLLAASLGIATIPAVSYAAGAGRQHRRSVRHGQSKAKEKCKNGEVRKNGKCVQKRTSPLSATIIVHVYDRPEGVSNQPAPPEVPEPTLAIRIGETGPDGAAPTNYMATQEHTLHVAPGRYEIQVFGIGGVYASEVVTVRAGNTTEVTLYIQNVG